MELSSVLTKVRALIEKAEHPSTEPAEAAIYRAKADEMMEKYAIEEWQALKDAGRANTRPDRIKIDIGEWDFPFLDRMADLVYVVARYCRCTSIWMKGSGYEAWGSYPARQEYCWVYGYESDLRYFELMYTTLNVHMAGAIFPKPDPTLTEGENIRELRNAGLAWNDIAAAYGWKLVKRDGRNTTYQNADGERKVWAKVVGRIKSEYAREIRRRGEQPFSLGRGGAAYANFQLNAIAGYIARINQRLYEQMDRRGTGAEIVLRDRSQNIAAAVTEDFPEMGVAASKRVRFNATAYRRGVQHANTASLNPEAGAAPRKGIQ
jgi:Protein of unknown function (DUF2786)